MQGLGLQISHNRQKQSTEKTYSAFLLLLFFDIGCKQRAAGELKRFSVQQFFKNAAEVQGE